MHMSNGPATVQTVTIGRTGPGSVSCAVGAPHRRRAQSARRASGEIDTVDRHCRCIEAVVARTFHLSQGELRGSTRGEAPIAFARQVAMYVAHVWFALSLSEVGRRFDRDRTTVSHACRVVEERRDDPRIDRVVTAIESAADLWDRFSVVLEETR